MIPIGRLGQVRPDRLKVLFYQFFPGGGIGRYTHELLEELSGRPDVEVDLACLPSFEWLGKAKYPVWPHLREIGHPVAWRRRLRFLIAQYANPRRLIRHARTTRPDIVHFSNINHLSLPFWWRGLRRLGVKIVATAHDVRRAQGIVHHGFESRQLRFFYRESDALFVHSEAQRSDLIDFSSADPRRVHIVPHGLYDYGAPTAGRDELRRRYALPENKQIALFFGMLRDDKNLDLFLRALVPHRDLVHVFVAGSGQGGRHRAVDFYRNLARELGIETAVTFREGYVPETEVPDLFEAADWVALPYSRNFTSQSGVLNVAARYRRPVLLSKSPTFEETLRACDVGCLVEPDDEPSLARGIQEIQARIAAHHRHQFEEYDLLFGWGENANRTVDVYRALLGR
jgi:glycosyltransferase involved in cell wall biosynthesis